MVDEEEVAVDIDSLAVLEATSSMEKCLAGKLLVLRPIACEVLRRTMAIA